MKKNSFTNLPQTLHANSGKGPSRPFTSGRAGAGDGDLRFLTGTCEEFAPAVVVLVFARFFRLGSEGFMKLVGSRRRAISTMLLSYLLVCLLCLFVPDYFLSYLVVSLPICSVVFTQFACSSCRGNKKQRKAFG